MTQHITAVDETLLLLAETRERAERAALETADLEVSHVQRALERVDRELLALHRALLAEVYFPSTAAADQLQLDAA